MPQEFIATFEEDDSAIVRRAPPGMRLAATAVAAAAAAACAGAAAFPLEAARCALQAGHSVADLRTALVQLVDSRGRPLAAAAAAMGLRRTKTTRVGGQQRYPSFHHS